MRRFRFVFLFVLGMCALGITIRASADGIVDAISAKLWSGDPRLIDEALVGIRALPARDAIDNLRGAWMQSLMDKGSFASVIDLSISLTLRAPYYTNDMEFLLSSRVHARLQLKQTAEALQDAKRLYNVAAMADMEKVMLLLEECLAAAHRDDHEIVGRFRREQINGYDQPGVKCTALEQIQLDAGPYAAGASSAGVDAVKTGRGNLLLLAGKSSEAQAAFEQSEKNAANPDANAQAVAGIARAMKAQDGTVGRANHYLREQLEKRSKQGERK